ncbi:hypothetical protein [Hirschia litorea]|uniref:Uncharacterized protein n=1 Tax=Hirschia litorea TaxID=1199156 RepID=A0ABW2IJW3_9PROT
MTETIRVCDCGEGTITYIYEMDDWNRTRSWEEFQCLHCKAEHQIIIDKRQRDHLKREALLKEAQKLATDCYLEKWLEHYKGHSSKRVWETLTGGKVYPALGTFYRHVRRRGLEVELKFWFSNELQESLKIIDVVDQEISKPLEDRNRIPELFRRSLISILEYPIKDRAERRFVEWRSFNIADIFAEAAA